MWEKGCKILVLSGAIIRISDRFRRNLSDQKVIKAKGLRLGRLTMASGSYFGRCLRSSWKWRRKRALLVFRMVLAMKDESWSKKRGSLSKRGCSVEMEWCLLIHMSELYLRQILVPKELMAPCGNEVQRLAP